MHETDNTKTFKRLESLKTERSSWDAHYRELSDRILPRNGRFFQKGDVNKGYRKHNRIYDSTGTQCARILGAGMMSGNTSPARPWVRLGIEDTDLNDYAPVKLWTAEVTKIMLRVFQKSNTYRSLHTMYEEQGVFGTGASIILPDYKYVTRHYPLTVGEYYVATDYRGQVNTLYREFEKTVYEVVTEFGIEKCSNTVKSLYNTGKLDAWVPLIHAIEPRMNRDAGKIDNKNMAFKSCYYEAGQSTDKYLRESGFNTFPAVVPRWSVTGGDIYGNSPGMEALGGINQLQHQQLRKAEVIDYKTKPPLIMPSSMSGRDTDLLPGGVMFADTNGAHSIRSAFEVNLDLSHLLADIQDVRSLIRESFYTPLFMMMSNQTGQPVSATEIMERHEEKMLMLGPVIERQQDELLNPLIDITFQHMMKAGLVPPPPKELEGHDIQVEFISVLAQAQRAVGTNGVDRFVNSLGAVATIKPDVLDKFDSDRWADEYADRLGIDPALIVPSDKVALIRNDRAKQQQMAQQSEMMQQDAGTVQKLASANTNGDNALTNVMTALQGYNS